MCTFYDPSFEDTALTAGWVPASPPLLYDICALESIVFNSAGLDYSLSICLCGLSDYPTTISILWCGFERTAGWGAIEGETGAGGAFSFFYSFLISFLTSLSFLSSVLFCWIISYLGKTSWSSFFKDTSFKFCSTLCSLRVFLQTFGAGFPSWPALISAKGSWSLSFGFC